MKASRSIVLFTSLGIALAAAGCHHDQPRPASSGTTSGSNSAADVGGASTENAATGGSTGGTPGDRYQNTGTDPATGMTTDGGVGSNAATPPR